MSEAMEVDAGKEKEFKKELASLLNRHGFDNACETPDYILADYVEMCLRDFRAAMRRNIAWHSGWKTLGEELGLNEELAK